MSDTRKKLQERLEHKIEQKKRQKQSKQSATGNDDNFDQSSSMSSKAKSHVEQFMKGLQFELELENDDGAYAPNNNNKFVELEMLGDEDEREL